jgi:hypothetical protein
MYFRELGVKHEQLKLITPQFETPLPPLQVNQSESSQLNTEFFFTMLLGIN